MKGTKISVNEGLVVEHEASLSSAQNLRDTVVNFVKVILILTFLPTGASDVLGKMIEITILQNKMANYLRLFYIWS